MNPPHFQFWVEASEEGARLDTFLSQKLPERSRSQIQKLIKDSQVLVNQGAVKASHRLQSGDQLQVIIPAPAPLELQPAAIALKVLYEDADLIAINKSAEMVMHPGAGNQEGTLVHALLHHCQDLSGIGGRLRPGIVHRLDKGTSGVVVVAKQDAVHLALTRQFQDRTVQKIYQAIVWGCPRDKTGLFESQLGRHPKHRQKMASVERGGREAVTEYRVLQDFGPMALVEARPKTGRTHQIRVHFAEAGHALVGDALYGVNRGRLQALPKAWQDQVKAFDFQLLHAKSLRLVHPSSGKDLYFEAALRPEMENFLKSLQT